MPNSSKPDHAINTIYELLFCDNVHLYSNNTETSKQYPWDVLLASPADPMALKSIVLDEGLSSRERLIASSLLQDQKIPVTDKILLGVIIEVGMEAGLDVLACYQDGSARYINYSGSMIIWDTKESTVDDLIAALFQQSLGIVRQIGPWDKARLPPPTQGRVRLSFLVTDGLYFGEGPIDSFFSDAMAGPPLATATALMQLLTSRNAKA